MTLIVSHQHPGILLRPDEGKESVYFRKTSHLVFLVFFLTVVILLLWSFCLQAVHMLVTASTDLQKDIVEGGRVSYCIIQTLLLNKKL